MLGGLCLALSVIVLIQGIRRNADRRGYRALEIFRFIIVVLFVATLFQPEWIQRLKINQSPRIVILADRTGSMKTRDVYIASNRTITARQDWLDEQIARRFWAPLEKRYQVTLQQFGAIQDKTNSAQTASTGTDINQAMESVTDKSGALRAVILMSDGDWNTGRSPASAATRLRINNVPVYCVEVGSKDYQPDIELKNVVAPSYALSEEYLSIPFSIQSHLPREVRTKAVIKTAAGVTVTSKDIFIPPNSQVNDSLILIPAGEGTTEYTLSVPVESDEKISDNNSYPMKISLKREKLRVLVVDSVPRWETRFLRNALMRDTGIDVSILLVHPNLGPAKGTKYISQFPSTENELAGYDVIFLGDIGFDDKFFTRAHAEMIKGLVEQQGSGLIFLPGIRGGQLDYKDTVLDEMMPVVLDSAHPEGFGNSSPSRLLLTKLGRGHRLTMLEANPLQNELLWKILPGFNWYAPVQRSKPGSDIIAVHDTARLEHERIPLLVTREYGNGKILFMGTDSAWRWRRGVEDTYHYRFWNQVVRWMAHQRHLANTEGIRFFYSPERPTIGSKIWIHATVLDQSGYPLKEGNVTATISVKSRFTETIQLLPSDGGWGVFSGWYVPKEDGNYSITISCPDVKREMKGELTVTTPVIEKVGQPLRQSALNEIAAISQGESIPAEKLDGLITRLSSMPMQETITRRIKLWCHPIWGGLLIGLLALYWTIRKLMGMI